MAIFGTNWHTMSLELYSEELDQPIDAYTKWPFNKLGIVKRPPKGYNRFEITEPDGKKVTKLIYTAEFYGYDQPAGALKAYKVIYVLLTVLLLALSFAPLFMNTKFNSSGIFPILEIAAMMAACYVAFRCFLNVTSGNKMMIQRHKIAVEKFRTGLVWAAILQLLPVVVMMFMLGSDLTGIDITHLCVRGMGLIVSALFLILEQTRKCVTIKNDYKLPEGSKALWTE